jgi:quercetin dioxygenase-like cupin family protein
MNIEAVNPYSQSNVGGKVLREFKHTVPNDELVWHRDKENRTVKIISGSGWKFQRDNHLPIELKEGDVIKIKKMEWHRIIKGNSNLKIEIIKK